MIVAISVAVVACGTTTPVGRPLPERAADRPAAGSDDDPEARDRWYWEQRTYPAGMVPLTVHREAVRRELAVTRSLAGDEEAWTNLGPAPLLDITYGFDSVQNSSGRALTLAIHPADPSTLLLGTAQGGIWKSTDRGASWRAVGELTLPTLAVNVIVTVRPTPASSTPAPESPTARRAFMVSAS